MSDYEAPKIKSSNAASMKEILTKMRSAPDPLADVKATMPRLEATSTPDVDLSEMLSPPKLPSVGRVANLAPQQKAALKESVTEAMVHLKSLFRSLQAIHEAVK